MEYPRFLSNNFIILLVCLVGLGFAIQPVIAQGNDKTEPPPPPPPRCQQDKKARPIGTRFLFDKAEKHYAQVLTEPADSRLARVVTDGILLTDRFDAGSVGPIVYHPDGETFAFIAAQNGKKHIFAYTSGDEIPYVDAPIDAAWQDWVCFGATGQYLFVIAKHGEHWYLDVRAEQARASFVHYPLNGEPESLELLAPRDDGSEGFQFSTADGAMQMEINSWFK